MVEGAQAAASQQHRSTQQRSPDQQHVRQHISKHRQQPDSAGGTASVLRSLRTHSSQHPSHAVCSCKQRSKQQWRQRKAHAAAQATAPQYHIDASSDSSSSVFVCMFRSLFVFCSACSTCMRTVSFFRCLRCRILIHWQISQGAGSPYLIGNVTRASEHFACGNR